MRMLMTVQMDTEAGNRSIDDGTLAKVLGSAVQHMNAESAYFTTLNGDRTAYIVFDLQDSTEIPSFTEPFFRGLNAKLDLTPVMNAEEMREGVDRAARL